MSPSILLGEIEPWLPAAVTVGVILLSILILLCKQRRKSAKPVNETKLLTGSSTNAPSQAAAIEEVLDDPPSKETLEEEPVTTYCNNGCQGACACPALDFQSTLPTSEPAVSVPSALAQTPSTDDGPPTDPLPEIPEFESQSSLPRRGSSKNPLQFIKDKFAKHDSLEVGTETNGSERRGSKTQGGKRKWSLFDRKDSVSEKEMHPRKDESNKEVKQGGGNKDGSIKEVSKGGSHEDVNNRSSTEVSNGGRNKEVSTDGSDQEVSQARSNAEVSGSESVGQQKKRKESLKLLKGMMSFKKTISNDMKKIHTAE